MFNYGLKRLLQAFLVLWSAFTVSFILLQVMPGDAALLKFLNPEYGLSSQQINELRAVYGFDQPVVIQYFKTIQNFLHGDLGFSIQAGVPVVDQLAVNLPPTLLLSFFAFLTAVFIAFALGFISQTFRLEAVGDFIAGLPSLLLAVPLFWVGIMLIQVFSFKLGWVSIIAPGPVEGLVLPVLTLALPISAPIAQVLIRAMDETAMQPFITVLRAKGAKRQRIFWLHTIRNALIPSLTIAGVLFGELISGAVVTESVFGLNGIGKITEQAVRSQDVTVLQAVVVLSAFAFVVINLLIDLSYPLIDPRLKKAKEVAYVHAR